MKMCYDGVLVMPTQFIKMSNDEMTYLEGGSTASEAKAIFDLVVAVASTAKTAGIKAGKLVKSKGYKYNSAVGIAVDTLGYAFFWPTGGVFSYYFHKQF